MPVHLRGSKYAWDALTHDIAERHELIGGVEGVPTHTRRNLEGMTEQLRSFRHFGSISVFRLPKTLWPGEGV